MMNFNQFVNENEIDTVIFKDIEVKIHKQFQKIKLKYFIKDSNLIKIIYEILILSISIYKPKKMM